MRSWGVAQVAKWALSIDGVTPVHTDILFQNEITGADMLDRVTEKKLERWGLPGGPAGRIMSALASINSAEAVAPVTKGESTGTSYGFVRVMFFAKGRLVGRSAQVLCTPLSVFSHVPLVYTPLLAA